MLFQWTEEQINSIMKSHILCFVLLFAGLAQCIPDHAATIRPPAWPLAVRNPYTNLWLSHDKLPGSWASFWTGKTKGWTGMVRIDGTAYTWMGAPVKDDEPMGIIANQSGVVTTPTQTHFFIKAGSLDMNVTFFSPVEVDDIDRQSIPLSYVNVELASNDGAAHQVELYMDISGEWATSDVGEMINWTISSTGFGLKVWETELMVPFKFAEKEDYAEWGRAVLITSPNMTSQSGSDLEVRTQFATTGALNGTNDTRFRCAACNWPTFGFSESLGSVSSSPVSRKFVVGNIREDNINWLGVPQKAYWLDQWEDAEAMIDFFWNDYEDALVRADELDQRILEDAFAAGGQGYADILTFSLRQAYAGNEFALTDLRPILYQKEISSGAFMQTVDVIYPAAPMFIYFNITYLELLLEPLFYMMENRIWSEPFAMHDIGARYPNAVGQGYGGDMPVEESSNMVMMVGDIVFHPQKSVAEGRAYAEKHYEVMSTWANYLLENCLYPVDQLTTDDFIGTTELNSGLALKGILAMATFAKISGLVGNTSQEEFYNAKVAEYVPIWLNESLHMDGDHLKMEYNVTDGYQFKYNALQDHFLELGVVPANVYEMEAAYYLGKNEAHGIPFVSTHDYTKSDWEMWTAAAFGDVNPALKTALIDGLASFLEATQQRVPFSDWYVTATARHVGFLARPVAGGHFALLAKEVMKNGRN